MTGPGTVHPSVRPYRALVGTWTGQGSGVLPGGEPFTWDERFVVTSPGPPALAFSQRTRRPDGGPFHAEDGWVRLPPERQVQDGATAVVELAVTSPTGVLEALDGTLSLDGSAITLEAASTSVLGTTSAGEVTTTRRRWTLADDTLTVEFWMATPAFPDQFHHLTAHLTRQETT